MHRVWANGARLLLLAAVGRRLVRLVTELAPLLRGAKLARFSTLAAQTDPSPCSGDLKDYD